jgi:dTDP-4-dehydrorhamnose 3,5-epimerase
MSTHRGVLRGLHFQRPPFMQDKLVRVIRGAVFDVAVDVRVGSPTFGRWAGVELTADNGVMLYVPRGFGHAYCTLTDDTEVLYKLDDYYAPDCERGLLWNDPAIGIAWPIADGDMIINARDRAFPALAAFPPTVF